MIRKAVIPAAGMGTRFLPATKAQPKEMLPIVDKPVIQFVVEEAARSGIDDILIITGRGKRAIEDHFDTSLELEETLKKAGKVEELKQIREISNLADVHYIRQKEQKGLGDAIRYARKFMGDEPFAVLLGDTIIRSKIPCTKQLMDLYKKHKGSVIAVESVPRDKVGRYGIVKAITINKSVYQIQDLVEKPKPSQAPSNMAIIGRYILTPGIFDVLDKIKPGFGGEIQLTDALRALLNREKMYACLFDGKRYDIGNKLDYVEAVVEFALRRPDFGDKFKKYLEGVK